ncbi:MAG: type I-C CRISPR-associated protein Cas8c/Csd1 [Clostridiales bacterium]|jgi:CRISPR-associated protein Csd1|nr:type I-C CRISPR-associated protein Cas8c/Csd1 [Eubacteriales bacterium]MDH7565866.1 type I-C CRISPR-associated protein Cas8c/Csd1 [Clostridiales bacterium]
MNWIQKLYETYDACKSKIGIITNDDEMPLLPICHTTQKAQIEIVIDGDGNFKRARFVPKEESRTIVPCTESSGGRAGSKPVNHPLCDKLQYIAMDFIEYGGEVTFGYLSNPKEPYENYKRDLKAWCESDYSHPKAKAVLKYIEKGNVIKDLVDHQVLFIGEDGKLLKKWNRKIVKDAPDSPQEDAFVRWIVEIPGEQQAAVWTDSGLFESWINYYLSTKGGRDFCYVTGTVIPSAEQHPAKLRNDGDKAKLISSNDTSGFTFRGRFLTAEQACGVGCEVTQKAHNALRWLIARQGRVFYEGKGREPGLTVVAWATSGKDIPDPLADPFTMLGFASIQSDSEYSVSTAQELAQKLKRKIAGYSVELGDTTDVVVMGMDSVTTGRMAIVFYRELTGSDFLKRIDNWHETCSWFHDYRYVELSKPKKGSSKKKYLRFVGAPAPSDIAEAAYGKNLDDKLRSATVERILPCIIDGRKIPKDLVDSAVRRASNRIGMEPREWNKTLSIACSLYKKLHEKEGLNMSLDKNRKTRDYLYGRLLALADDLEQWALNDVGEERQTNAARLMQRFADRPYTTWRTIELALSPYKARLGGKSLKRQRLISEVIAMFEPDDFISDKKLSGEFLLGYHCQCEALRNKEEGDKKQTDEDKITGGH